MLRHFALCLLLATTALAKKPTFESVLKKFPVVTLPLTLKESTEQKTRLTSADLEALGVMKDTTAALAGLRAAKTPAGLDEKKSLWAVATIQRTGYRLMLVRADVDQPMANGKTTFLLSFDDKNTLLGGLLFHQDTESEAGKQTNVSTLDQAGVLSRLIKTLIPMHEEGLPEELKITSEQRAKVTSTGAFEVMAAAYSSRSGSYLDHKSKEELRVFDKRVFYRANDTKPFQELEGDGNTLRFKGSPRPYILTWNDRRSDISCENPDGAVQLFTREW